MRESHSLPPKSVNSSSRSESSPTSTSGSSQKINPNFSPQTHTRQASILHGGDQTAQAESVRQTETTAGLETQKATKPASSVDALREALNAKLVKDQMRSRAKSHLDQFMVPSPPGSGSSGPRSPDVVTNNHSLANVVLPDSAKQLAVSSHSTASTVTPSYPFPKMMTPRASISGSFAGGQQDQYIASTGSTPAAPFNFGPPSATFPSAPEDPNFPPPNLYDVSLQLHSESGLDSWWMNVINIATTFYKAERITLSVPTDLTDLENAPWGQRATFDIDESGSSAVASEMSNPHHRADSSSTDPIEDCTVADLSQLLIGDTFSPPIISSPVSKRGRKPKKEGLGPLPEDSEIAADHLERSSFDNELPGEVASSYHRRLAPPVSKGQIYSSLLPIDQESSPLLDNAGVVRVLHRGKPVVLLREYRDLNAHLEQEKSDRDRKRLEREAEEKRKAEYESFRAGMMELVPGVRSELILSPTGEMLLSPLNIPGNDGSGANKSSPLSKLHLKAMMQKGDQPLRSPFDEPPTTSYTSSDRSSLLNSNVPPRSTSYEEYEQPISSPWSQSPAPSPAIRSDPNENPFFQTPKVDEDSFNPTEKTPDYSKEPVRAIGLESASTVIHIPLVHPSISKSIHPQRQHSTLRDTPSGRPPRTPSQEVAGEPRHAPIAILSMLSDIVPYPPSLVKSLSHFAPLAATSYSLAEVHNRLVSRLPDEQVRYRADNQGTLDRYGREKSFDDRTASMTSPSEYSSVAASAGSSVGSPTWEHGTSQRPVILTGESASGNHYHHRQRSSSTSSAGTPSSASGMERGPSEGYFAARQRGVQFPRTKSGAVPTMGSMNAVLGVSIHGTVPLLEDSGEGSSATPNEGCDLMKASIPSTGDNTTTEETGRPGFKRRSSSFSENDQTGVFEDVASSEPKSSKPDTFGTSPTKRGKPIIKKRRQTRRAFTTHVLQPHNQHSLLHSYGADYAGSFPPVTPSTKASGAGTDPVLSTMHEMPPPSNKLLRTIIDSIPVHVFTAAPSTGEPTWVNARTLSYRGMTVLEYLKDPWESLHPEDRDSYLAAWENAVRKGEPFSQQVRIRRFDGAYRYFIARAVPLRDSKGMIVHWFGTNMDVHDQKNAENKAARQAEMVESESKYRSLANSSPQIVFSATANQGITYANTQWLKYSGQTLEQALNLGFMGHVHPADRYKCTLPGFSKGFFDFKSPPLVDKKKFPPGSTGDENASPPQVEVEESDGQLKDTFTTELRIRSVNGDYRWHLVRCVTVEAKTEELPGMWIGTCTDINDHKLLEQKLKEANDAAQKTMESKTRFLSNMSHEIRTPLIGISGMVNFLMDTSLDAEQLDYCHTISQSSEGLLSVINDILDLSKVEAGMMKLSPEWFHIRSLVEEVNELLSTMAIAKELELNYVIEEDVPSIVSGDRVRLRQVLLNIIGNAIKFTTKGEVFSKCSLLKDETLGPGEVIVEFECHDTGPGFDKEEEELMFKPFSQIDGSSTRVHGGSGLGLVISRQLVELHGGKMSCSSVKGEGSVFVFSAKLKVPAEDQSTKSSATVTPETGEAALQGKQLLTSDYLEASPPSDTPPSLTYTASHSAETSPADSTPSWKSTRSGSSISSLNQLVSIPPSAQDPATMKFALPPTAQEKFDRSSPPETEKIVQTERKASSSVNANFVPPMFSILVVTELKFTRQALTQHIKNVLPKSIPNQISTTSDFKECRDIIWGNDPVIFTHLVINLPDASEIIALVFRLLKSEKHSQTMLIVITTPMQRTAIIKDASAECETLGSRLQFVYKPIKPSRLAVIFDPQKERDASTDRTRNSAQQVVESQKRVFNEMQEDVGNRGIRVLLVEDNPVNQKVILRFLAKVGLEVESAYDGQECVNKITSNGAGYYGVVLCDLHMPKKDGFQACSEIRRWENETLPPRPTLPIIALSANVMSDVWDRCAAAGFSRFVSKPVDFKELSDVMKDLLDTTRQHELMRRHSDMNLPTPTL